MAQFLDDFSGYTIGLAPPGYSDIGNGAFTVETLVDADNGVALRIVPGAPRHYGVYNTAFASELNVEIAMRAKYFNMLDFGQANGSWYRNTGSNAFDSYQMGLRFEALSVQAITRSAAAILSESGIPALGNGSWSPHRGRVNGNNQSFWRWADLGTPKENTDPTDESSVDSSYPSAGRAGMYCDRNTSKVTELWVDWWSIGTDGDPAPLPGESPEPGGGDFGGIAGPIFGAIYSKISAGLT